MHKTSFQEASKERSKEKCVQGEVGKTRSSKNAKETKKGEWRSRNASRIESEREGETGK